ncbi:MAG: HAD-IC family P-type ATPase [Peptococcaceae bacterium]|nr:HAD-IC family P-type ATPase [Peptococcaceae bacterium]
MTVVYKIDGRDGHMAATKGAPETVLPLCKLEQEVKERVEKAALEMAGQAMRVLALACKGGDDPGRRDAACWESGMTFAGLVGLVDPVRPDVPEAVAVCRTAGIRVMMITGDAAATARAVANRAGIVPDGAEPVVLTGKNVTEMSGEQLREQLRSPHVVFARMQPEHKLRVVSALQEMGEVVAMTGDGVNDAPALRKSDIGVAMGLRGTDVARESADMVLLDDHFATIVSAVEEGRAVFANIRKFMTYFFASNVPEMVPFLSYVLLRIPLPLSIIQVMAVDLGTDMLPALALGMEKPRREMMKRPPRSREERLLTAGLLLRAYTFLGIIEAVAGMSGYFHVLYRGGWQWGQMLSASDALYRQATTACLAAIILAQVANLFACRSQVDSAFRLPVRSNPFIFWGIAWIFGVLLFLIYTEPGRRMFRTWPLPGDTWLFLLIFPPLLLLLDEGRKWLARRMKAG